jgi:hypothetical protein
MVPLRYHSDAFMDEDRKANRVTKKPMAGRHRDLTEVSARGQTGAERLRRRNAS